MKSRSQPVATDPTDADASKPVSRYRRAHRSLKHSQKSGAGTPAYLRWINRPLGRRLAAFGFILNLKPNHLTALSLICTIGAVALLAASPSTLGVALGVTALLLAGYALDSADGQLARLRGEGGPAGEWLDHIADAFRIPLLHLGVAIHFGRQGDTTLMIAAGVFMLVGSAWFFSQILAEQLMRGAASPAGEQASPAPAWHSLLKTPLDTGFLYLGFLLLPMATMFAGFYIGLLTLLTGVAALSARRKYSSLKTLSPGRLSS